MVSSCIPGVISEAMSVPGIVPAPPIAPSISGELGEPDVPDADVVLVLVAPPVVVCSPCPARGGACSPR